MNLPASYDAARTWQLIEAFSQRAGAIPGVVAVAAVSSRPLDDASTGLGIGAPADDRADGAVPWATWRLVTPNYFRTIGVPVLRGRTFDEGEEYGWPEWQKSKTPMPVIVSDRVARLIYPDADPIGREIILWKGQGDSLGRIVGVVGNMRERGLSSEPTLAVYLPARGVALAVPAVRTPHDHESGGARAEPARADDGHRSRGADLRRADIRRTRRASRWRRADSRCCC